MCCGIRSAVAKAYIAPAECARIENFVISRWLHMTETSSGTLSISLSSNDRK